MADDSASFLEVGQALFDTSEQAAPKKKARGRPKSRLQRFLGVGGGEEQVSNNNVSASSGASSTRVVAVSASGRLAPLAGIERFCGKDASLVLSAKNGRMDPSPLMDFLLPLTAEALTETSELDQVVLHVAKFYLSASEYSVVSSVAMGKLLGADPWSISGRKSRLASFLFAQQILMKHRLEEVVSSIVARPMLHMYLDWSSYDETPMKLRLKDPTVVSSACNIVPAHQAGLASFNAGAHVVLGHHGQAVIPRSFRQEVALACYGNNSLVSKFADDYGIKLRSVCTDRAPSNKRAEVFLANARPRWNSLQFACDIHGLAICHKRAFSDLLSSTIRGMLHCALALRFQHCWQKFKMALVAEIGSRHVVRVAELPPDAHQYQKTLLMLFFEGSGHAVQHCVTLLSACSGDWRKDVLEVVVLEGERQPSNAEIKQSVLKALTDVFLRELAGTCLLCTSYTTCMAMMSRGVHATSPEEMGVDEGLEAELMTSHAGRDELDADAYGFGGGHLQGSEMEQALHGPFTVIEGSPEITPTAVADANSKDRSLATAWLSSDPVSFMVTMIIALRPLDKLFVTHFKLASEAWELKEQACVAKTLLQGQVPAGCSCQLGS
eukprot:1876963-Amphidinium_carterae.1